MLPAPIKRLFTRPGHGFALLVVLGLAIAATPLAEVWRRQGLELQTAFDARRALEPMALAVQAQRALAAHRPFAAAVLAGRSEQEPERLRRQQVVDSDLGALVATLEVQRLHRALDEGDQLRGEWSNLLEGIGRRGMTVAASDAAHDLLVEQAFVIMDLVGSGSGLQAQVGRAIGSQEWTLALRTLPRYSDALAACRGDAESAEGAEAARRAATGARRAARQAGELLAALDTTGAEGQAPDPALVRGLVALRQSALQLVDSAAADPTGRPAEHALQRAHLAVLEANVALLARLDAGLAESAIVVQRERSIVALVGLLAALLSALAARLALSRRALRTGRPGETPGIGDDDADASALDTTTGRGGAESEGPASDLLERLRRRGLEAEAGGATPPQPPTPP